LRSSLATDVTPPAPDAESLSCAIAARYAGRWARSVARPQAQDEDAVEPPAPWFVDGFAGADLQRAALRSASVQPVAIAAVQALDEATRIVLVEEDPGLIIRLRDELDRIGAGDRIRLTADPTSTEPGEIALVEAPFATVAVRLASRIGDEPALVRLAPLAARALPWAVLEPIAELAGTDVLLRVPLEDFAKQARFTGPLADFPPHLRRVVEGCSALMADARHGWISAWREAQRTGGADAAPAIIVERLQVLLAGLDEDRSTHALPVQGAGGPVHLVLSTPHPAHALELDGAAADGAAAPRRRPVRKSATSPAPAADSPPPAIPAAEASPAPEESPPAEESPAAAPVIPAPPAEPIAPEEPAAVLDLFALSAEPEPVQPGPDLSALADDLHARHTGAKVLVAELLAGLVDSGLTPEQVRAALAILKRAGRATYRSLDAEGAEVEFLAKPRVAAPRPRKPRKPAPGELGLFDEPEG
jgi:hypothetical protein